MIRHILFLLIALSPLTMRAEPLTGEVTSTMKQAARYFHGSVARHGGYVYYYSPDLSRRLGEGAASAEQIWVQPPGTPTVGTAYLRAYEATKDAFYLEAARDAARALVHGQLVSGGWTNAIDFDPRGTRVARYRNGKGKAGGRNFSTLDDGITQAALQFLIQLDRDTGFEDKQIHTAATAALASLLKAQFSNGGFPQGWDGEEHRPVISATARGNFPAHDWRTEGRIKEYWDMCNLNDDIALTVADTLIVAHRVYQREDCLAAIKRLGDFLILAQMPEPQRAWAQQYNYELQPIWARKFEPPAIASRESEGVVAALLKIAVHCRDHRYLKPIPSALEYLEASELPGGKLARYYELRTNAPLYMRRKGDAYFLTHDDSRLPAHYGWKNESRVEHLRKAFDTVMAGMELTDPIFPPDEPRPSLKEILSGLDAEGRWLSAFSGEHLVGQPKFKDGEVYIHSGVFSRNLKILSDFVK